MLSLGSPAHMDFVLQYTGFPAHLIDEYMSGEECNLIHPHPEGGKLRVNYPMLLKEAARRSGRLPQQIVVMEDKDPAVKVAKAMGFFVVGISTNHSREELSRAGADLVAADLGALDLTTISISSSLWASVAPVDPLAFETIPVNAANHFKHLGTWTAPAHRPFVRPLEMLRTGVVGLQ